MINNIAIVIIGLIKPLPEISLFFVRGAIGRISLKNYHVGGVMGDLVMKIIFISTMI